MFRFESITEDVLQQVERAREAAQASPPPEPPPQPKMSASVRKVLDQWGAPLRLIDTLWRLEPNPFQDAAEKWAAGDGWCLVLSGSVGGGKSTAALWWLAQLAKEIAPTRRLRQRWYQSGDLARLDGYGDELGRLASVPSLVLDDLGVDFKDARGAFQQRLDWLLDKRHGNYRRTVITTNLNAEDFTRRHGERLTSRIREGGVWFEMKVPDLRGKGPS